MSETQNGAQPITLGALIEALRACTPTKTVVFDFCGHRPGSLDSYRGYYDHLAFDPNGNETETVEQLLARLDEANGEVYEGYKGGDFLMGDDTPMWVAEYGTSGNTCVTGVFDGWVVVLTTGHCEDWNGGMERARKVLFGGLGWGNVR